MNNRYYLWFRPAGDEDMDWQPSILWPDGFEDVDSARAVANVVSCFQVDVKITMRYAMTEPTYSDIEIISSREEAPFERF